VSDRGDETFTRRELREATGFGDTQLKIHLARLVDLEYVEVNRAGPATTYQVTSICDYDLERSDENPDRSGENSDRSAPEADRSAIGRSRRPTNTRVLSQLNDGVLDDGVLSVGIGRVQRPTDTDLFEQVTDLKTTREADRSGLRHIRGTGPVFDDSVIVAEAAVGVGG
jgi:hypothetical protein